MFISHDTIDSVCSAIVSALCGYAFLPTIIRLILPAGTMIVPPGKNKAVDIEVGLWDSIITIEQASIIIGGIAIIWMILKASINPEKISKHINNKGLN